jgi:hypothetical protein
MKHAIPILALSLLLLAQTCDTPPKPTNFYCAGAVSQPDPDGLDALIISLLQDVQDVWNTIVGGTPSTDRRATVFVSIVGTGSCSGVILGPHTVLTAGHCNGENGYRIYLDRNKPNYYQVTGSLIHPGYYRWSSQRGEPHDDLMLLYVNETLPKPYISGFYQGGTAICESLVAQGWGQTEATTDPNYVPCPGGGTKCLRESSYTVFVENPTAINTKQLTPGGICFGDSGGPLYALLTGQPEPFLAGITSTTASSDCKVSATHVKVSAYKQWIKNNFEPPS